MELTKDFLKRNDIKASKALGQNFIFDDNLINEIIDSADISKNDLIIEIGPGLGSMTGRIADRAGFVAAVEIDKRLIPILNAYMAQADNFVLINNDILKVDINREIIEKYGVKPDGTKYNVKVVSNLPYYITTPIIMKLLEDNIQAEMMIFMVQSEVAQRICAVPGGKEYGALSVAVRYYAEPEFLFTVPPHFFTPQPNVDSAIVRLAVRNKPYVETVNKKLFFKTVKAAFSQRRKILINSLANSGYYNIDKVSFKNILADMGLNENVRGEELDILKFAILTNKLDEAMKNNC